LSALTPTLYLPVEEANRELNSKILVGISAIKRGMAVVIGQQWLLVNNHAFIPRGVILLKGLNARQANAMRHLKQSGHLIAANDEEAMGLADQEYIARDIAPEIHEYCDLYLSQGPIHAEIIKRRTGAPDQRVAVVGNPRLDLLRDPFRAAYVKAGNANRERYGDYVLVNTNHGCFNTAWGSREAYLDVQVRIGWIDRNKPEDMELFERHIIDDEANFQVNLDTVKLLRKTRPNTSVIIRPHQAERLDTWKELFADDPGVKVLREGSHLGWMLGAKIMLNTGCTTGLEAAVVRSPVLNVLPESGKALLQNSFLSNHVNVTAIGATEAARVVQEVVDGNSGILEEGALGRAALLREHYAGIEGPYSHEGFAEAIDALLRTHDCDRDEFVWNPTKPAEYLSDLNRTGYQREKITLSFDRFREIWNQLAAIIGDAPEVRFRHAGESLFLVERA